MSYVAISTLPEGTRVATLSGTEATLIYANSCRARVRIGAPRLKSGRAAVPSADGEKIVGFSFTAPAEEANWSPGTQVRVVP